MDYTKYYFFTLFSILFFHIGFAQIVDDKFGEPTSAELTMTSYPSDPSASGILLYDKGNYKVEVRDNYIVLVLKVHQKIKVLDAKEFNQATVFLEYYTGGSRAEKIDKLQAITHNGNRKMMVSQKDIYNNRDNSNWSTIRFTFPDVQDGSVLEYTYELISPYFSNLRNWNFAGQLPTLYSELHLEMPGNFIYNKTLYGNRKLDYETAQIKKACFHLPGFRVPGDCEVGIYIMKNVPAIKKENFMLSPENYSPSLRFELVELTDMKASKSYYANTWKNLDGYYKGNSDIGRQLRYASYLKDNIPAAILNIADKTERAKAIFYFIQDYMFWNGLQRFNTDTDVKKAFTAKSGHSSEINLALVNALEAGGLDVYAMLISTRNSAMPSELYPVLSGFNNIIAYLVIDGQKYFLDATNKNSSFGILPFNSINGSGRVLDFKNGSYWEPIVPGSRNIHFATVKIKADENGMFMGIAEEMFSGYMAQAERMQQESLSKADLLQRKQSQNEHLEISNLEIENRKDLEQPLKEKYEFAYFQQKDASKMYLRAMPTTPLFDENPFLSESRLYPIDLVFPMVGNYLVSIDLNDKYKFVKVPENKVLQLPNNDGDFSMVYSVSGNTLNLRFSIKLNTYHYPKEAYKALSQFFTEMIKAQSELIEIERI